MSQVDHQTVVSVSHSFQVGTLALVLELYGTTLTIIILYVMWESIILIVPQLLSVVVGRCSSVLGISGYCYVMNFNSQVLHWGVEQITVFEEMTADVLLVRTIPADIFTPLPSSLMLARHTFS